MPFPRASGVRKVETDERDTERHREVLILLLTGTHPAALWEGMDTQSIRNRRQGLLGSILESRRKEDRFLFFAPCIILNDVSPTIIQKNI